MSDTKIFVLKLSKKLYALYVLNYRNFILNTPACLANLTGHQPAHAGLPNPGEAILPRIHNHFLLNVKFLAEQLYEIRHDFGQCLSLCFVRIICLS
ncbi:MAG: hypothetical protein DRI57_26490 [Deltaproteobacteria bacterium]|nr:MAG: hypothetical protein DRI57_26490 [Deltaproteobacteria bacterium]